MMAPDQKAAPELDAETVAAGFGIPAEDVRRLMKAGEITGKLYLGQGEDEGSYAYILFHQNSKLTLILSEDGTVLKRSRINFGDRPLPGSLRNAPPPDGTSRR
ncbi:DUF6522 family protein [Roseibium suaedae]|uniref:Uncharacterized protein n=1 Tax=Roseibium suaedae TaxID=735517 RepID=A0A1M7NWQ1_9HYPH|nr:DUF6522 family protein [Roseibium suaedae]SHN08199.1 hypothetical protein SAMN05444272_4007 [Roseibium suaedae]